MDLNRQNDPGTGNHYTEIKQEIHIGSVGVYNNATTIHNTYTDGKLRRMELDNGASELESVRKEILDYVGKTLCLVEEKWKPIYMDLWDDILDIEEVSAEICDRGRQQNTAFNRKLVVNIIYYLGNFRNNGSGMYGSYNATTVVSQLEGTTNCNVRVELGMQPSREIRAAIDLLLKSYDIH